MSASGGPWVVRTAPHPGARLRLVCFAYAGGGSSAFADWPRGLPDDVEVCAVRLPGRESRIFQRAHTDVEDLLPDLTEALAEHCRPPFALFGHSMGALIAFALTRRLRALGAPAPAHLVVSGRRAPQLAHNRPLIHHLPEEQFLARLRELGGTPDALLADARVMRLVLPGLRADFQLNDSYTHRPQEPLPVPITAFGGRADPDVDPAGLAAWARQSTGAFTLRMFDGGHFFLHTAQAEVLAELSRLLRRPADRGAGALTP
ncbi:surfactin synthase thioesterase subunit [Kitasatospora sp. SolWspMP-SS2h]|uniref:thioesterase II family protein n=1 Tax=Kitasatospora sp. SolWspMP-SS2h TaxID=1305729 RepID=UPI000DBA7524|nr:alpha/beta fold hydrolase [Kitasatospora sp. SolWspMP-SS2h]RAJ38452.1 surfactin synthase thioesterase subunit [Kitasatospora sp. SolWspMP-SS2h]